MPLLLLGLAITAPLARAQATSVVKLIPAPNNTVQGQPVTLTAGVNQFGAAVPSGTITIYDTVACAGSTTVTVATLGTLTLGLATSQTPGAGTLDVTSFPCLGQNSLVAVYGGDANYLPASSQPVIETVLGSFAHTTISLGSSETPTSIPVAVTLTARLAFSNLAANTYPTGTVTFTNFDTGKVLGTGDVQTSGAGQEVVTLASMTTTSLAVGSYNLQAAYSGNNIYSPSTSPAVAVVVSDTVPVSAPPAILANGVVTASSFGKSTSIAPGTWVEIYGSKLASGTRSWTSADFQGLNAPTSLDGTTVTIGGQPAFLSYVSPGQVNAQVPSNIATGSQLVTVTTSVGSSAPYYAKVNATQPGLLVPTSFKLGGRQYVAALFPDGATFVLPSGAIAGITSQPARPGDIITFYGVGFGPVAPDIPAGQIVQDSNALVTSFQVSFADTPADVQYAGLAPGALGLYQFNVVVPDVAASDAVPVVFTVGGVDAAQTLFIPVQN